ncbi:MAG: hypothetical protein HYT42_01975 [Candidatus Sungbacteria bacterium]|nr:hypothetical protein [Candidatus Sungbacteria bacterium]
MPQAVETTVAVRHGVARVVEERKPVTADELQSALCLMLNNRSVRFTARTFMNELTRRGFRFDDPGQPILVLDLTAVFRDLGLKIGVINPNVSPEFTILGQNPAEPQA